MTLLQWYKTYGVRYNVLKELRAINVPKENFNHLLQSTVKESQSKLSCLQDYKCTELQNFYLLEKNVSITTNK